MAGFVVMNISQEEYDIQIKNKAIIEFKQELLKNQDSNMDAFIRYSDICRIAEEIKEGDSDLCEWKYHRTIDNVPMYVTSCLNGFEESFTEKYIFCPYCGKRKKVIERKEKKK